MRCALGRKTARHGGLAKQASIDRDLFHTTQWTCLRALQRQRVKPVTICPRLYVHADRRAVACRRVIGAACQARACSSVDRVLASEARGRGFESRQARHQRSSTAQRFLQPTANGRRRFLRHRARGAASWCCGNRTARHLTCPTRGRRHDAVVDERHGCWRDVMLKIAIILGSTRPGRKGEAVAQWVFERARARRRRL